MKGDGGSEDYTGQTPVLGYGLCVKCRTLQRGRIVAQPSCNSGARGDLVTCVSCDTKGKRRKP